MNKCKGKIVNKNVIRLETLAGLQEDGLGRGLNRNNSIIVATAIGEGFWVEYNRRKEVEWEEGSEVCRSAEAEESAEEIRGGIIKEWREFSNAGRWACEEGKE